MKEDIEKLYFYEDAFYNGELIFEGGKVHEVSRENGWAERWMKRGAIRAEEKKIKNSIVKPQGKKEVQSKPKLEVKEQPKAEEVAISEPLTDNEVSDSGEGL